MKNLRLLPFSSRFLTQIEYWSAACFKDIPLDENFEDEESGCEKIDKQ